MDNNLPNNPSNPNNNPPNTNNPYQSIPSQSPSIPSQPSYPSTPQTPAVNIPESPNNTPSVHQEVAQHRLRDAHGQFLPYEHPNSVPKPETPVNLPDPSIPSKSPGMFSKFCHFVSKLSIKKITVILAFISLLATNGIILNIAETFFPNSSPFLHRSTAHQGLLKTSGTGAYQLVLPDNSIYTLYLKPSPSLINLKTLNEVVVKGNLTGTPYVIENAEIYPVNITAPNSSVEP